MTHPAALELGEALAVLERTPATMAAWLEGLPQPWLEVDEGPDTFTPIDVLGHLIHGERTDWMVRVHVILEHGDARPFEPFDRVAHRASLGGRTISDLLREFAALRAANLADLRGLELTAADLARPGRHPDLGLVTLGQLLAAWVVHDASHVGQIARVLARRYETAVGPWRSYFRVFGDTG
jgi:DinB superfamily